MKRRAAQSKGTINGLREHRAQFSAVRDSRNRRLPGLYLRNGRYYGQLWVEDGGGGKTAKKFPLKNADDEPARTLNEAKEAMEVLRNDRREQSLPATGRKPSFPSYIGTYFAKAETLRKKPGTLQNERQALARWQQHLGAVRIDRIPTAAITGFKDMRLHSGASARTVNLDQIALRNVLKCARDDGYLRELPPLKKIKEPPVKKRPLLTPEEFRRLLAAVDPACKKNAVQFRDYLNFLAYSGAREQEALRVRWEDVDFKDGKVTIGADGASKNREARTVEFNDRLGALLREMAPRRAPDCAWVFPSPQRGERDAHAKTFRESLRLARAAAGLEWVGFHDLRHAFASHCVMAGLDFMTTAVAVP